MYFSFILRFPKLVHPKKNHRFQYSTRLILDDLEYIQPILDILGHLHMVLGDPQLVNFISIRQAPNAAGGAGRPDIPGQLIPEDAFLCPDVEDCPLPRPWEL